eukprot:TRINITY_DN7583_c0_g1_i1.p1 TRINITY_DN7583_c0_g1~~TRINITY_DN7583_c0_g1_i1.p1  ORF type:complete len:700 (+),score=135.85 TRINITY_DN7583_c0_g1_i1:201-2300(+)
MASEESPLTVGGVQTLYQDTRSSQPIFLQVCGVHRYSVDPSWRAITETDYEGIDVYDIVLNDGEQKTKCVLSPSLYDPFVTKRKLSSMPIVEITEWKIRKNEIVPLAPDFCMILKMNIAEEETFGIMAVVQEEQPVPPSWFLNEYNIEPKLAAVPLIGARGFYWSLMSDDTPFDKRWDISQNLGRKEAEAVEGEETKDETGKPYVFRRHTNLASVFHKENDILMTISEILATKRLKRTRTVGSGLLVARVQKKTNLTSFSPSILVQEKRKYPLTFALELIDHTGYINCQIWEGLCALFYGKIEIGDVISIRGFRIKHQQDSKDIEISVNPGSNITIITGPLVDLLRFPFDYLQSPALHTFSEFLEMNENVEGVEVTLIGIITFVSEMVMTVNDKQQKVLSQWVILRDESDVEIPVRIFSNSQSKAFKTMTMGDIVALSHINVRCIEDTIPAHGPPTQNKKIILATSTRWSQYYNGERLLYLYEAEYTERYHALRDWLRESPNVIKEINDLKEKMSGKIGEEEMMEEEKSVPVKLIHFRFQSSSSFKQAYGFEIPPEITFIKDIYQICQKLQVSESTRIFLQGYVQKIHVVPHGFSLDIVDPNREHTIKGVIPSFLPSLNISNIFDGPLKLYKNSKSSSQAFQSLKTIFPDSTATNISELEELVSGKLLQFVVDLFSVPEGTEVIVSNIWFFPSSRVGGN